MFVNFMMFFLSQLSERADKTLSKGNEWELACFDTTQNCVERGAWRGLKIS